MKFLLSTKVSMMLIFLLAASMGVATFVENDHGTAVARAWVYEAWWFEGMMVWLCINFVAHIKDYRLFTKEKLPLGLFHLAFIIIILGAGVTRLFSKEGVIHIRTGSAENTYYTSEKYLQVESAQEVQFAEQIQVTSTTFEPTTYLMNLDGQEIKVSLEEYLSSARETFLPGEETLFEFSFLQNGVRKDEILSEGKLVSVAGLGLSTSPNENAAIEIWKADSTWYIRSAAHLQVMEMATQQIGAIHADSVQPLKLRSLYQWAEGAFVVRAIHENSRLDYISEQDEKLAENYPDGLKIKVSDSSGQELTTGFFPNVSYKPKWLQFEIAGKNYHLTYGPMAKLLPFSLHLNAFELKRYPGSQSPESYASEVMILDEGEEWPYRIFMNNVLDHKGYRFYQSSYDSDERGTVLSINQDRPGTYLTYFGYFLLSLGMLLTLFAPGSRFQMLQKRLAKISAKTASLVLLAVTFSATGFAQEGAPFLVPEEKAQAYGSLIVQDLDGRMKPLNTLANEIARKLNGRTQIEFELEGEKISLSPEQFLLAVQLNPERFSSYPLIKIDQEKSLDAFQALGHEPVDRLSFQDFIDEEGNYLLANLVEEANQLKPSQRNEGHKELLKTDERFNIFYAVLIGDFLRLYPNRLDDNETWYTSSQFAQGFEEEDGIFVKNIGKLYLAGLQKGIREDDWSDADEALGYISLYQKEAGKKVYPTENEINGELLYNKLNLGNRLFGLFWLLGLWMLILGIIRLFKEGKILNFLWKSGSLLAWIGWGVFTFHLALRWYIAKHPPWSDGFEMMVFVAWGVLLFGLIFSSKSRFTIPLGLLFSGTLLFVGFLDWLNPEITNLMPVLHSYWLKIHVAIIVSGYAPLALSAIIALLSLCLLIFKPLQPSSKWWLSMKELIVVNELSLTIGLFLLTIGTFLGGVWANESWGRYWAWDPKETWALISILVYAVVLHLRLIPGTRSSIIYNLASLWAFAAIIMTSFGVNYYLSGLHSYAKGDPVPVPFWVYILTAILVAVSVVAFARFQRLSGEDRHKLML
ncbi:cytochrome c biogenesis protein [Algoriphagus namhaensis]